MDTVTPELMRRTRVGTDLVSVRDVRSSVDRFGSRYLDRVYTALERRQSADEPQRLAARFAGKEAVVKVLRLPPTRPVVLRDIEIALAPSGAPLARLRREVAGEARAAGIRSVSISLSHDHEQAMAVAVASLLRKDAEPVKQSLRSILDRYAHLSVPVDQLADHDDLYRAGLTSHATVDVMLAVEEELEVEFTDDLMMRATFASIDALESAVVSLRATA